MSTPFTEQLEFSYMLIENLLDAKLHPQLNSLFSLINKGICVVKGLVGKSKTKMIKNYNLIIFCKC